jgi:hypothetical protein
MCYKNCSMDYNYKYLISNGVLIITFHVSTLEHVEDEARQVEEHMVASETTLLASDNQAGKEHSNVIFINKILLILITKNINLTFLSYSNR